MPNLQLTSIGMNLLQLLIFLMMTVTLSQCVSCPAGVSIDNPSSKQIYTYSSVTDSSVTYAAAMGASGAVYRLEKTDNQHLVMKSTTNGTVSWIAYIDYSAQFMPKSLVVNPSETKVYICSYSSPITVFELDASTGSITKNAIEYSETYKTDDYIQLHISTNGSYIYFPATNTAVTPGAAFWRFAASTEFVFRWITIPDVEFVKVSLYLATDTFFLSGLRSSSTTMLTMKIVLGSITPIWAKQLSCIGGTCSQQYGVSVLNNVGDTIYMANNYGISNYFYLLSINESNGALAASIYKSNNGWNKVEDIVMVNDSTIYGLLSSWSFTNLIFQYTISTNSFIFYKNSAAAHAIIPKGDWLHVLGDNGIYSWNYTFHWSHILRILEFSADSTSMAMTIETGHSYEDTSIIFSAMDTVELLDGSITTVIPVFYVPQLKWIENIVYYSNDQTMKLSAGTNFTLSPEVTWSTIGELVSYTLSDYGNESVPSWVEIDSSTGVISGSAPNDKKDTSYRMYISSTSPEFSSESLKLLELENTPKDELSVPDQVKVATAGSMAAVGVTLGACTSVMTGASLSSVWAILEEIQLLILVMSLEDHIPDVVERYLEGNTFLMFTLNFIPTVDLPGIGYFPQWTDAEQKITAAKNMGLESGSTFTNHFTLLLTILVAIVIWVIAKVTPIWSGNKLKNILARIRNSSLNFFFFTFFVRTFIEAFVTINLSGTSEIYQLEVEQWNLIISLLITIILMGIWISLIWVNIIYCWKYRNQKFPEKFFFMQLFDGLNNNNTSRLYRSFSLTRKLIFVLLVVFFEDVSRTSAFSVILASQTVMWVLIIVFRPFENFSDNLVNIITEGFVIYVIALFFALDSEDKWTGTLTDVFIYSVIVNSWAISSILSGRLMLYLLYKLYSLTNDRNNQILQEEMQERKS
jgi:hypothetical protein